MGTMKNEGHGKGREAPDGGWGWVIAIGVFLIALVVPMLSPSFGILFSRQLLDWEASSTTVALIFNAFMVVWRVTGVILGSLAREFGYRRVAMTGTLLTASCLTLSALAKSPTFLFVSFSLGCGFGNGLSCVGYLILAQYFHRRRGLANTWLMAGAGMGHFFSPLLIRYLQGLYGLQGAIIIVGAIMLHGFLGATVFHPVEWHYKNVNGEVSSSLLSKETEVLSDGDPEIDNNKKSSIQKELYMVNKETNLEKENWSPSQEKYIVLNGEANGGKELSLPKEKYMVNEDENEEKEKLSLPREKYTILNEETNVEKENWSLIAQENYVEINEDEKSEDFRYIKALDGDSKEKYVRINEYKYLLSPENYDRMREDKESQENLLSIAQERYIERDKKCECMRDREQEFRSLMAQEKYDEKMNTTAQKRTQAKIKTIAYKITQDTDDKKCSECNNEKMNTIAQEKTQGKINTNENAYKKTQDIDDKKCSECNNPVNFGGPAQSSCTPLLCNPKTQDKIESRGIRLCKTFLRVGRSVFSDMAILKRPPCFIIALGSAFIVNSEANFTVMVPFAIQASGHSLQTAAWCVSISGICSFWARLVVSPISDLPWFNMRLCYMGSLAMMSLSIILFTFQTSDVWLASVMGVWGIAVGIFYGLNNLLMTRIIGLKHLTSIYSAKNFTVAMGFFTVGPFVGVIRDLSGSYKISMWVLAAFIIISFVLWIFMPAALNYEKHIGHHNKNRLGDEDKVEA